MKTSTDWIRHFEINSFQQRVNWDLEPCINPEETAAILPSLQAWQLGETSDGSHLIRAAGIYAERTKDPAYLDAVRLFIKEEQKHGNNLGRYLDLIKKPRIKKNWGDTLFRKIRYFNTNMEIWTVAVITVESAAQVFYQSLKDATKCTLLKDICTDILIDEAYHITFQKERMAIIFDGKSPFTKMLSRFAYPFFFFCTSLVIWMAHKKAFKKGGTTFSRFMTRMRWPFCVSYMLAPRPGALDKTG